MKKVLIIDKSFAVGGIQTALINMVKALKDTYEIDVLVFHNAGVLKKHFPEDVRIIEPTYLLRLHGMGASEAKEHGAVTFCVRNLMGIFNRIFTNRLSLWFAMLFQKKLTGYDAVIAFHHEDSIRATVSGFYRFAARKTDAPIKLGWIHYDPEFVSFDDKKNEKYMRMMDKIICVSQGTADKFVSYHPALQSRVDYCYNFHDIEKIRRIAQEAIPVELDRASFNCFSACRLTEQKAIPRAIKAFAPVLRANRDVKWYIAGDGKDREECERLIQSEDLTSSVFLLGALSNPYAYMSRSDLYIQPSIYEAAPMVYGEALICKVPIFTTSNISSSEMVDEKYGCICENTPEDMRAKFAELLENREKVAEYKKNLKEFTYTNALCAEKIGQLLGDR